MQYIFKPYICPVVFLKKGFGQTFCLVRLQTSYICRVKGQSLRTSALHDILTQVLGMNKWAQFCAHPGVVVVVVLGNAVDG